MPAQATGRDSCGASLGVERPRIEYEADGEGEVSVTPEFHEVGAGRPHHHTGRRIALAGLLVLLALGGTAAWKARSTGSGHRLIYTQTLPDGRVFHCFADGSVIGAAGTEVGTGDVPAAPEGSEAGPVFVVRPPDFTEEEARRAAEEYRRSGRTFEQDEADFDRLSAECERRR